MNSGRLLKIIRAATNKPLGEVAAGAGVSSSHLSRVEKGTRMAAKKTIDRILASILAESRRDFPGEEEPEPKDIEDYDPAYVLELASKIRDTVNETVALHQAGKITRVQMVERCAVLLKSASDLKIALDVASLRRKAGPGH
jgi:transcriptional regulator with XRE-family HTH domain